MTVTDIPSIETAVPDTPASLRIAPSLIVGVIAESGDDDHGHLEKVMQSTLEWLRATSGRMEPTTATFAADSKCGRRDRCWKPLHLQHTPILLISPLSNDAERTLANKAKEFARKSKLPLAVRVPFSDAATSSEEPIFPTDPKFAAACEYVASVADLLVTVSDREIEVEISEADEKASSYVQSVVAARRRGPTPGLLPMAPAISWADIGPVLHVVLPGSDSSTDGAGENSEAQRPKMRLLFPFDAQPYAKPEAKARVKAWERAWMESGERSLRAVAAGLESLNSEPVLCSLKDEEDEFRNMLPVRRKVRPLKCWLSQFLKRLRQPKKPEPSSEREKPQSEWKPLVPSPHSSACSDEKLHTLAAIRRRVATLNYRYDARIKRLTTSLFWAAVVSLICFQFYIHGNPETPPVASPSNFLAPQQWIIAFAFVFGLVGVARAWRLYRKSTSGGESDRQNDFRALAEGLRVQFYWTAAGICESVTDHYLQRGQREVWWIRGAIRSVALPSASSKTEPQLEHKVDPAQLRERFEQIGWGWIDEQQNFFRNKVAEFGARRAAFIALGETLLWAGTFLTLLRFCITHLNGETWLELGLFPQAFAHYPILILGAFVGVVIALRIACCPLACWFHRKYRASEAAPFNPFHSCRFLDLGFLLGHRAARIVAAAIVATCMISAVFGFNGDPTIVPAKLNLVILLAGLCIGIGALIRTRASQKFLGENIRRYSAMRDLFSGARRRLDEYLAALEACADEGKQTDANAASDCNHTDTERCAEIVHAIRALFLAVGKEALNENSEWLIMHRDRPVEPMHRL